jgi:hypothetical protein
MPILTSPQRCKRWPEPDPRSGVIPEHWPKRELHSPALTSRARLRSVGEIDQGGYRKDGLDAFLEQKIAEGYLIETRTETHAIVSRRPKGLKRFTSGSDPGRYVVEVDEGGTATMRPAEPRRM